MFRCCCYYFIMRSWSRGGLLSVWPRTCHLCPRHVIAAFAAAEVSVGALPSVWSLDQVLVCSQRGIHRHQSRHGGCRGSPLSWETAHSPEVVARASVWWAVVQRAPAQPAGLRPPNPPCVGAAPQCAGLGGAETRPPCLSFWSALPSRPEGPARAGARLAGSLSPTTEPRPPARGPRASAAHGFEGGVGSGGSQTPFWNGDRAAGRAGLTEWPGTLGRPHLAGPAPRVGRGRVELGSRSLSARTRGEGAACLLSPRPWAWDAAAGGQHFPSHSGLKRVCSLLARRSLWRRDGSRLRAAEPALRAEGHGRFQNETGHMSPVLSGSGRPPPRPSFSPLSGCFHRGPPPGPPILPPH